MYSSHCSTRQTSASPSPSPSSTNSETMAHSPEACPLRRASVAATQVRLARTLSRTHCDIISESESQVTSLELKDLQHNLCEIEECGSPVSTVLIPPVSPLSSEGESEFCVICQREMWQGDEAVRLPCFHAFHSECILPYLRDKSQPICPVDRTPIDKSVVERLPIWYWGELSAEEAVKQKMWWHGGLAAFAIHDVSDVNIAFR